MGKILIEGNEYSVAPQKDDNCECGKMIRVKCKKCGGTLIPFVITLPVPGYMEGVNVNGLFCLKCRNLLVDNEQKKLIEEIKRAKETSI